MILCSFTGIHGKEFLHPVGHLLTLIRFFHVLNVFSFMWFHLSTVRQCFRYKNPAQKVLFCAYNFQCVSYFILYLHQGISYYFEVPDNIWSWVLYMMRDRDLVLCFTCPYPVCWSPFNEQAVFSPLCNVGSFVKFTCLEMFILNSGSSRKFHSLMCLILCQYHTVFLLQLCNNLSDKGW